MHVRLASYVSMRFRHSKTFFVPLKIAVLVLILESFSSRYQNRFSYSCLARKANLFVFVLVFVQENNIG